MVVCMGGEVLVCDVTMGCHACMSFIDHTATIAN